MNEYDLLPLLLQATSKNQIKPIFLKQTCMMMMTSEFCHDEN